MEMSAAARIIAFTIAASALFLAVSCTSGSAQKKADTLCTPGQDYYCRCQNFDEGSRTCNDDGQSFGACLPCDGDYTPPAPDSSVMVGSDAGSAKDDATTNDASTDAPTSTCGNGKVDPGEACDDGNTVEDDGCNSMCMPQGGYPPGTCPGMPVHVWQKAVTWNGTTTGFALSYRANAACGGSTGSTGSDRVYAITPHQTGTLQIAATNPTFDIMLYARSDCATQSSEVACTNAMTGNGPETFTVPVTSGSVLYLVVDGATNATGTFTLSLTPK
jgi:cysteine-rich repeat protein